MQTTFVKAFPWERAHSLVIDHLVVQEVKATSHTYSPSINVRLNGWSSVLLKQFIDRSVMCFKLS
jgi:hypothetical protein